jgi:DNA polymerase elongation subunit (family B)
MSKFYTNVHLYRNEILLRGYENGERVKTTIPYKPYLFVSSRKGDSMFRTLNGKQVDKMDFDSVREARDFINKYKDVAGFDVYGLTNFVYTFINDTYTGEIDYDPRLVSVVNIDIEVAADEGFPSIQYADKPITAITMKKNDKYFVLGCGDFKSEDPNVLYLKCKDEEQLLIKFLDVWSSKWFSPDIVTGWNVEFFDIPYIINRIKRILSEAMARKMSPWNVLEEKTIVLNGNNNQAYLPVGITILDYMQLYRKFSFVMQESYRLDHIAHIELGERKLNYSEFESLFDLYKNDYQKFIEYNIKDVDLVDRLDQKLKLIEQVYALAYDGKVNYSDTFTSVRMWDVIIHNYLLNQRIVVPQMKVGRKDKQIIGAFVKDPKVGAHKWVVSFDLNSLYPHLIMQYNISPETYAGHVSNMIDGESGVEKILNGFLNNPEIKSKLKDNNLTCSASGCLFDKDYQGFLPKLMEKMYNDRVIYKDRMIEAKKRQEVKPSDDNVKAIAQNHNMQLAKKIQLNSAYGALSNEYFRWFDDKLAESITLSGQLAIKWIEREMNAYLNKMFKTEGEDYVIACDTDSMYITLDNLVSQVGLSESSTDEIVKFLDKVCERKFEPFIDGSYERLGEYVNAYAQKMKMKREAIADKGIWTAKKRYILNVYNDEGVSYSEPKLKIMGIEAVRSSTPAACRDLIKKALVIIMNKTQEDLIDFISTNRAAFNKLPFESVSFPRGCKLSKNNNGVKSLYSLTDKGLPIHVRGSLIYNKIIKEHKLDKRYQYIQDGDKIKFSYMRTPNPIMSNVIACTNMLPKQLDLDKYIDYDTQFEKSFLHPIKNITNAIGWQVEKTNTIEDFFA